MRPFIPKKILINLIRLNKPCNACATGIEQTIFTLYGVHTF